MTGQPRQERALIKRRALLDAANALFSQQPFEAVTAKGIASRAEVAVGTFYQNFNNKDEILREIAAEWMAKVVERVTSIELGIVANDSEQRLEIIESRFLTVLGFIYEMHSENPSLHQIMEHRRDHDEELDAVLNEAQHALLQCVTQFVSSFRVAEPGVVAANLYAMAEGLVHALVFNTVHRGMSHEQSLESGAKMLASYFSQIRD